MTPDRQAVVIWQPTQGYLNVGRFDYGQRYTITKPHYVLKTADGLTVGAIQWLSGDDGVMQVGRENPHTLTTSLLYALTNYGRGGRTKDMKNWAGAAFYIFGPWSDYPDAISCVEKIRDH
jgi:hypothetical protein